MGTVDSTFASSEEQFRLLMESVTDYAIFFTDCDRRIVTWNTGAQHILGWSEAEIVGQNATIIWTPEDRASGEAERELETAATEGRAEDERWHLKKDGSRFWASGILTALKDEAGNLRGYCKILRDLTERKRAEQRLRSVFDSQVVGVIFWNLNTGLITDANDTFLSLVAYSREDLEAGLLNFRTLTPPEWTERNEEGVATIRSDGAAPTYEKEYFRKDGSRIPILIGGTRFEDSEAEGYSFILDITERKGLEIERERLLLEARARAARETLINQIGDGIRQSLPPEEIEALAVRALGKALASDRCYVFTADTYRDLLVIAREWYTKGVVPIAGQYRLSEMGIDIDAVFGSGETLVVPHLQSREGRLSDENAATNQRFQVSSLVNVPFYEGGRFVGALAVAMAQEARDWTGEEITLVETVAGQLRSILEAARLQQRERNIAQQLQDALQPPPPPHLPGLALQGFYKPALAESQVGGDFFDVFPIEKGCTALVVGDLSGKGLAAASEVATVRNMVRYAIYSGRTLAEAITGLDRVLVEHDLLAGFATLFVGIYAQNERTLTFANCGQEPGLIWRTAMGKVERLAPTGPVIGGFASAGGYAEETVLLAPGDVLALFTDGMTEIGPNRRELLEIEGLTELFARCCAVESGASSLRDGNVRPSSEVALAIRNRLIAGVEAYAGSAAGRRDDIALLVGAVDGL
jgi:PAS domain S-box-containing protein